MSRALFIVVVVFAVGLAAVLSWMFWPGLRNRRRPDGLAVLDSAPQHLCNMGTIRRSQDPADLRYAAERVGGGLAKRLRRERRAVAMMYLDSLRSDFEQLQRIARVVALLLPDLSKSYEYERLRLSMLFRLRLQLVRARLLLGDAAMEELALLGQMVSSLAIRLETAMETLGERAALAASLTLQSDK